MSVSISDPTTIISGKTSMLSACDLETGHGAQGAIPTSLGGEASPFVAQLAAVMRSTGAAGPPATPPAASTRSLTLSSSGVSSPLMTLPATQDQAEAALHASASGAKGACIVRNGTTVADTASTNVARRVPTAGADQKPGLSTSVTQASGRPAAGTPATSGSHAAVPKGRPRRGASTSGRSTRTDADVQAPVQVLPPTAPPLASHAATLSRPTRSFAASSTTGASTSGGGLPGKPGADETAGDLAAAGVNDSAANLSQRTAVAPVPQPELPVEPGTEPGERKIQDVVPASSTRSPVPSRLGQAESLSRGDAPRRHVVVDRLTGSSPDTAILPEAVPGLSGANMPAAASEAFASASAAAQTSRQVAGGAQAATASTAGVADAGAGAGATAQVSTSLLTLRLDSSGSSRLSVSLQPKQLGAVQIQLDRRSDGEVMITVTASEPSTLRSLMADQAQLHSALDAAAVPSTNRHLSFELSNAATSEASPAAHPQDGGQASPDMSSFRSFSQPGGEEARGDRHDLVPGHLAAADDAGVDSSAMVPPVMTAAAWSLRSGSINITA